MRTITDIYAEYKIPKNLQLHQLRVAAVAKIICDNLTVSVDTENVVRAALLHDMGNIIKFDLGVFPESLEPEGRDYWEGVKKEYIETYGTNEHEASIQIARVLTGNERIVQIVETVDFGKNDRHTVDDFGIKIAGYSDTRVCPYGVASLLEREEDGARRYSGDGAEMRTVFYSSLRTIEAQLQKNALIDLKAINDALIAPVIEELKTWQV